MSTTLNELEGIIFRNSYKNNDKAPDFKGRIMINGVEKEIALWTRQGNRESFFSCKINDKYVKANTVSNEDMLSATPVNLETKKEEVNYKQEEQAILQKIDVSGDGNDDLPF